VALKLRDGPTSNDRTKERTHFRTDERTSGRTNERPATLHQRANERTNERPHSSNNDHTPATTTTLQQQTQRQQPTHRTSARTNKPQTDAAAATSITRTFIHSVFGHSAASTKCTLCVAVRQSADVNSRAHSARYRPTSIACTVRTKVAVYRRRRTNYVVRVSLRWRFDI